MAKEKLEIIIDAQGVAKTKQDFKSLSRAEQQLVLQSKAANRQFTRMRVTIAGLRRSLGVIRNNLLLVTFAFGGLIIAMKKAIDNYRIQFEAEQKLIAGLANVEGSTIEGARALINYAGSLQTVTQFGDEAIIGMMAMLSTFQLNETAIKELTPRVLDMATATGQDLVAAGIQVGKAFTGMVGALSRSGVVIDQTGLAIARAKGRAAEFNFLLGEMDRNFKGLAETIGTGPLAELKKMENQLGDVGEEIGREVLPITLFLKRAWRDLIIVGTHLGEIHKIMYSELVSYSKAIEIYLSRTNVVIDAELKLNQTLKDRKKMMITAQELVYLEKRNLYLSDDGIITNQEQLNLLMLLNAQYTRQAFENLITKEELTKKILELDYQRMMLRKQLSRTEQAMVNTFQVAGRLAGDLSLALLTAGDSGMSAAAAMHDAWHRALRSIIAQIIANAAILALANILMPGAGIMAKSGGLFGALLGGVKFAQHGMDQTIFKPTIIVAGERGPERVRISPQASPAPSGNVYNLYLHAPVPEDYIRNDLLPILSRVQATG